MFCKNCRRHYNEDDPEYLIWMDGDSGYCSFSCESESEFIAKYGEQAYKDSIELEEDYDGV